MNAVSKPRKPWIAGLLSLLTIGNGHIYAGRARRGLFFYVIPQGLILAASIALLIGIPAPTGLVLLLWALANLIVQPLLGAAIKRNIIQTYKISSAAMQPTILVGDHLITKKHLLMDATVKRGDIVIFPYPKDPAKDFIKRVVGLGGERLEIKDKRVYIDGRSLEEPYAIHSDDRIYAADENPRDNFGPMLILPGYLFVMGDNRDESHDSRFWGFVPAESLSAKACSIYWSWDKAEFNVRWNRVGAMIP